MCPKTACASSAHRHILSRIYEGKLHILRHSACFTSKLPHSSHPLSGSNLLRAIVPFTVPSPFGLPFTSTAGMTSNLLLRFREYLQVNLAQGQNGHCHTADYVSRSSLKAYWTMEQVRGLLDSCEPPLAESEHQIRSRFLLIFSILVYIEKPRDISIFITTNKDDHHLPFDEFPRSWPSSLSSPFLENQWMFCPLEFTIGQVWKRRLPTRQIMPVEFKELVGEERRGQTMAHIRKVKLHSDCDYLNVAVCIFFFSNLKIMCYDRLLILERMGMWYSRCLKVTVVNVFTTLN